MFSFCKESDRIIKEASKKKLSCWDVECALKRAYQGQDWYHLRFLEEVKNRTTQGRNYISANNDSEDFTWIKNNVDLINKMESFTAEWVCSPSITYCVGVIIGCLSSGFLIMLNIPILEKIIPNAGLVLPGILFAFTFLFGFITLALSQIPIIKKIFGHVDVTWDNKLVWSKMENKDAYRKSDTEHICDMIDDFYKSL